MAGRGWSHLFAWMHKNIINKNLKFKPFIALLAAKMEFSDSKIHILIGGGNWTSLSRNSKKYRY